MSGRCRSCDSIMEEWEMKTIDPLTSQYTELCHQCMGNVEIFDYGELSIDQLTTEDPL